jgi:hypothetical protein
LVRGETVFVDGKPTTTGPIGRLVTPARGDDSRR